MLHFNSSHFWKHLGEVAAKANSKNRGSEGCRVHWELLLFQYRHISAVLPSYSRPPTSPCRAQGAKAEAAEDVPGSAAMLLSTRALTLVQTAASLLGDIS